MDLEKMSYISKVFEQQKPKDQSFLWEIGMVEVVSALLAAKQQPITVDMSVVDDYNLAGCKDKLSVHVAASEETLVAFNHLMQRAIEIGHGYQSYSSEEERLAHQVAIFNLMSLEMGLGITLDGQEAASVFPNFVALARSKAKEFEEIHFEYRLGSFGRDHG